ATIAAALAVAVLLPRSERVLRAGAWLYVAAVLAAALVSSPMGSNVGRLGVLLGAPLLGGLARRERAAGRLSGGRGVLTAAAVLGLVVWTVWGPVREVDKVRGDPSDGVAYYQPLAGFLDGHLGLAARVEVPFTRAHWESNYLARRFALARGWERQLDT